MTEAEALARFREFYDTFSAAWLPRLTDLYAVAFVVEDPFVRIDGDFAAMHAYYERVLKIPVSRFITEDGAIGKDGCYIRWRWEYKLRERATALRVVPGVTHVRFDGDGKITFQQDLFDAAGGFYDAVPVLGAALRFVKKRIT